MFVDPMQKDEKWQKFQKEQFNSSIQPYYYILNPRGEQLVDGMDMKTAKLKLKDDLLKYKKKN
ncbi:hypothetical protein [Aquimarina litoralis]|uniref:hypothetical protein n=1 Tax=Aquimarina litoralis TaxID=584605 RepID=UPI001C59195A|nr:hypothetical protein [Aquimarina litoralis]MBW1296401.1 hypothetical protein [Aquimarina litoralis]